MKLLRITWLIATVSLAGTSCAQWPVNLSTSAPLIRGDQPKPGGDETAPLPPRETARLLVVHGDKLIENGREALAVAQYEKARSVQPDYPGLAHKLAVLYDRLAQDQKALQEYRQALDQQPNDPCLLNDFGYFHYQRGRYAEAERYFRQALQVCEAQKQPWRLAWKQSEPLSPKQQTIRDRIWVNLGLTLAQQRRYQDAFSAFSKALSPAQAHYNLAVVLLQRAGHLPPDRSAEKKQLEQQARFHLQQALQLDSSLRQARTLLAELDNPGSHSSSDSGKLTELSSSTRGSLPSTPDQAKRDRSARSTNNRNAHHRRSTATPPAEDSASSAAGSHRTGAREPLDTTSAVPPQLRNAVPTSPGSTDMPGSNLLPQGLPSVPVPQLPGAPSQPLPTPSGSAMHGSTTPSSSSTGSSGASVNATQSTTVPSDYPNSPPGDTIPPSPSSRFRSPGPRPLRPSLRAGED